MKRTGQKLLRFDRRLGARFVAGADEAGRGSLAGPLVVAGVLLDYGSLRDHRVRPLGFLNDSKQCSPERREDLFRAVVGCAERVAVRVIPPGDIDRNGLHRSNLAGLRAMLEALTPPAEACLVDGFRLGPAAPEHTAVVDGDEKSAAIAAASIVAKVTRDRLMRRLDALYPAYGFAQHVGYITPGHSAVVRARGPSAVHRLSFQALCYEGEQAPPDAAGVRESSGRAGGGSRPARHPEAAGGASGLPPPRFQPVPRAGSGFAAERRAVRWYRLRGWRILGENVWAAGNELDLIVRRGRVLRFVEVKEKRDSRFGDPLEMLTAEKQRRLRRAAEAWLGARPELARLAVGFDVIAVRDGRLQRVRDAF